MKTYVWLSFAFLGWGYYEMSGGADFVPEDTPVLAAAETSATEELVTRANAPTLLAVSTSNVSSSLPVIDTAVVKADTQAAGSEATAPQATVVQVAAPAPVALDIRQVAGSRVNMRMGPNTDYDVITTLDGGTDMEVLEVNAAGWARVIAVDRGIEGWMAERLLTPPQG